MKFIWLFFFSSLFFMNIIFMQEFIFNVGWKFLLEEDINFNDLLGFEIWIIVNMFYIWNWFDVFDDVDGYLRLVGWY